MGITQKVVDLLISSGNEIPKGFNKAGNLEPYMIGVDLDKILDKLVG